MPVSVYSHYQDPKTGQTSLLPNFLADSIDMSSDELETWKQNGLIPEDIYTAHLQERRQSQELWERLNRGESVPLTHPLASKPGALTEYLLKNKARLYGEQVLIRIFSKLMDSDPDVVWLFFIKQAMQCLKASDPLQIHFYAVRKILKEKYNIEDPKAIDVLARELVEHCARICEFKIFQRQVFLKNPIDIEDLDEHFKHEKKPLLELDETFIAYLKSIGKKGRKLAVDVEKNCKELFNDYEKSHYAAENRRALWSLWIPDADLISPVLRLLCVALWEDRCQRLWNRGAKGHPSLIRPIVDKMISVSSPHKNKKFIEKEGSIICYDAGGDPILTAPAVDPSMIALFKEGVKGLSSLTGHKMLRWQVKAGFESWATGKNDPRLIKIDGGYSKIAELIQCTHTRDIATVKEILHAQAHGYFNFPDGSRGNMITLRIEERYKNQEPSKIHIVLGDMLLPDYLFQAKRRDTLLVPIGDLPPLHGSPNSHASQAQLQLLVFKEFSNQSDRLAQEGSILITEEKWKQLAYESGLSPDKIDAIIHHWCQPDLFNCFLEKQGEEYRLASYYNRAQLFLEDQGKRRIVNSKRGKMSAEQKIKPQKT